MVSFENSMWSIRSFIIRELHTRHNWQVTTFDLISYTVFFFPFILKFVSPMRTQRIISMLIIVIIPIFLQNLPDIRFTLILLTIIFIITTTILLFNKLRLSSLSGISTLIIPFHSILFFLQIFFIWFIFCPLFFLFIKIVNNFSDN